MNNLNTVAEALGYSDSKKLFPIRRYNKRREFALSLNSTVYYKAWFIYYWRITFILFFSEKTIIDFKTIWFYVPFVFVLSEDTIYIYNGKKIVPTTRNLEELEKER